MSDAFLFAAAFFGGFCFGRGSNSSSFCGRPGRTRSSSCDTPSIVFEFEFESREPFAPFFIAFFIARRSAAETRAFPPRAEFFSIASGASSALSASSPSRSQCAACSSACSSATGACARVVSTDPSRNASSALDAGRRVSSETRRGPLLFSSGSSVSSPSSSSWKRSSVSSSTRVVLSAACLLTSSSLLTKNTYAYPITSGAGGKYRLRPTCHTTPGASASPFSATRRTAPDGTHHALITVLVSHAALRHKHAAPACAKDKEGTRHFFVCVPESSFFP